MKNLFKNPKKAIITIACVVILIAIIAVVAIFATTSFAENASIGKQNAQNFAFVDAGVDPVDAKKLKTEFEFKNGQFIYEIEFEANGTEYDYWIKASDGSIVKKEVDSTTGIENQKEQEDLQTNESVQENQVNEKDTSTNNNNSVEKQTTENKDNTKTDNKSNTNTDKDIISLNTAKNKALSNANVSSSKATFTKTKLDYDDGIEMYEIEFYTSTDKYEYEINAKTGAIIKKEVEAIKKKSSKNTNTSTNSNDSSSYIGVDKAKSIALNHAGVSNVVFEKAKLDRDDGKMIYEIEFYKDNVEYGYEIDATSGKILDYDIDND